MCVAHRAQMRWLHMALDHPSFGFRCHDLTLELWLCSFLLFFVFLRLDFDSELMFAKGVPRMTHTTFETFNVSALLVTIQAVSVHFERHDGHRVGHWRSCVAHSFDQRGYTLPLPSFVLPRYLTKYLMKFLTERGYPFCDIVRDVKENLRYIELDFDTKQRSTAESTGKETTRRLPDGNTIIVGAERFRCPGSSPHTLVLPPSLGCGGCPFARATCGGALTFFHDHLY